MMWDEWYDFEQPHHEEQSEDSSHVNFEFLSLLSKPKDYYKILEVDFDASDEAIRSNYIRLALKWHPDKKKDEGDATSKFQEINEAYQESRNEDHLLRAFSRTRVTCIPVLNLFVHYMYFKCAKFKASSMLEVLSDPVKRDEYDRKGMVYSYDSNIADYLNRYKSLILTCNGLGMKCSMW